MRPLQIAFGFALGLVFTAVAVSAWADPPASPPNCPAGETGCDAPVNVGTTQQIKDGALGVNSLAVFGNTLLWSSSPPTYLNFGETAGSDGYGIRDDEGTMEFKDKGGAWDNLEEKVLDTLGAGAITQITFSDGTTQTTAASGQVPQGMLCGFRVMEKISYSAGGGGSEYGDPNIPCNGVTLTTASPGSPPNNCPTGYSGVILFYKTETSVGFDPVTTTSYHLTCYKV